MKKAFKKITVIVVLVFTSLLLAQPQDNPPVEKEHCGECEAMAPAPVIGIPNLTDAQREQIQTLHIKHLKEILPIESELQIKGLELAALWSAEKLDTRAIVAKVKEINDLRSKLELARVNQQIEIYNLLTPEQRKQFRPQGVTGRGMMGRMRRGLRGQNRMGPGSMPCCPER